MWATTMLAIVLVLLVATSALGAPQVRIRQKSGDGRITSNSILEKALYVIDAGEVDIYTLTAGQILRDRARNPADQAQAFGQAIVLLGELSTGSSGDACAAANLINTYVRSRGAVGNTLYNYIRSLTNNIDNIVRVVVNPGSVRYATGSRGSCLADGRAYQFDAAWDIILANVQPYQQLSIVQEEYCYAKRLYNAFNARSNNVGAQLTAASLPVVANVFNAAAGSLYNLVLSLASGGNPSQAAAVAKQALLNAASRF